MKKDDIVWVVNDNGELGVKIGNRFFFCYKGGSLEYTSGKHDDDSPMMWRRVGKREFGECVYPICVLEGRERIGPYTVEVTPDMGPLEALDHWQPLPRPRRRERRPAPRARARRR